MERERKWLRLSAFGLATAIALLVTMGVPVAMQYGAPATMAVEAGAPTDAAPTDGATRVAIQPASIHVIALRERSTVGHRLSFAGQKPAG